MARPSILLFLLAFVLPALLGACVTLHTDVPFDAAQQEQAAAQLGPGDGRISGYAFVHGRAGRNYTAAGDWITLVPATAYADARVKLIYGDAHMSRGWLARADAPDPDFARLTRRTKADIRGHFSFDGLMPGDWYVFATVSWEKDGIDNTYAVHDRVALGPGESKTVVLSGH